MNYPDTARRGEVVMQFTKPGHGVILSHPIKRREYAWLSDVPEAEFQKIDDNWREARKK